MDSSELNRIQLMRCIKDIAERAEEIGEQEIACCCFAVAASIIDGSYPAFADISNKFARIRLDQIKNEEKDENGA